MSDYKKLQKKAKLALKKKKIVWTGGTLDLGIRKFKRKKPRPEQYLIDIFKENVWNNIKPKKK